MPALGDYIGRLVAELASGRVQADVATARLAEMYRADPLLAHMPVPRFRLPQVTISAPFAIADFPDPPQQPTPQEASAAVLGTLRTKLAENALQLSDAEWQVVEEKTNASAAELANDQKATASQLFTADALTNAALGALPDRLSTLPAPGPPPVPLPPGVVGPLPRPATGFGAVAESMKDAGRLAVLGIRTPVSQLNVHVTSAELEAVDPNKLVRITLTMNEHGMEWQADETHTRLVPE